MAEEAEAEAGAKAEELAGAEGRLAGLEVRRNKKNSLVYLAGVPLIAGTLLTAGMLLAAGVTGVLFGCPP